MPNNLRKNLVIFIIICGIILIIINVYAAASVTLKSITYNGKTLSFYADCIKFHVKANGYSNKLKDEMDNNLYTYASPGPGRELQPTSAKMQGYGNYVFKEDTSLFDFIQFCYLENPGMTMACSTYNGANELSSCDYTKLCTFSGQNLNNYSKLFVDNFWTNMTAFLGETFNSYQDLYFYDKYTNKGASLVFSQNRLASNGKEFLTCMMSYIFSNNQNSAHNLQIKKGDIVPFLYVKEHIDDTDIKNNPREIAKFAYLACIEGWAETTSNDLWFEEYEAIYGNYDEEEICDLVGEDLDTLAMWYTETDEKYQMQKGNKGNPLLGSTIDTIIKSDYSITQQLEATDHYLQNIEGIGDYKENMARNELMAKYMMENSHIGDTIKDYNVGITFITENLQRGTSETKNTKTAILSDFQVLEFDHTLNKDGHSDDDGISDLTELTNNTKWVNITGPATRTYNDAVSNGTTTKSLEATFQDYEDKSPGIVKYEDGKLYYKTYNYNSNPMLNDTDFDGMNDNIDGNKTDGTFKTSSNPIGRVEWTNDFRYFFIDNDKYNDELSTMSLMMCNLADGNSISGSDASGNINTYLNKMGFTNVSRKNTFKISPIENISGNLYIGKKTIQVGANKKSVKGYKDVYGIFLGGFDTENNYKKLVTNFNTDEIETYYETISIDINDFIDNYIGLNPNGEDFCYWICGYSIAGGIASHVSPYLVGKGETYAYTFGAPNTTKGGSTANVNIKNIINEDDVIPKVLNRDEGYSRVGALYNDSIYDNLQLEYRKLIGNLKDYQVSPKITNTLKNKIKQAKGSVTYENFKNMLIDGMAKYFSNYNKINSSFNHRISASESKLSTDLKELLNNNVEKVKKAHEIKAYYTLAKTLNGFDLNNYDEGWTEIDDEVESGNIEKDDGYEHIYVEVDWDRRYPPDEAQLQLVADSFKQHNIILHIDAGAYSVNYSDEEIQKSGQEGKEIEYPENGYAINAESLERIVRNNFSFRKNFRYCMYVDQIYSYNDENVLGRSDAIFGRMFLVANGRIEEIERDGIVYNQESRTFMHELGHTLGLYHGGNEAINYKPNYISIMNYLYRDTGLIGMRKLNYSEYEFNKIEDFNHINEVEGIDKYCIAKEFIGINWALKSNENEYGFKIYSKYYNSSENRSMDFNRINNLENNANVDFYIEYEVESGLNGIIDFLKQHLFYDLGLFRSCRESVNDWERVYKNIIPPENIIYSNIWY